MDSFVARRTVISHFLVIAIAVGTAVTAVGQATPDSSAFGDIVDVELINVEVWVTDAKDEPIHGLTAEDFEIREDGKPVAISHFAELRDTSPSRTQQPRPLAPSAPSAEQPPRTVDTGRHLVLYFDQLHLRQASRKQVVDDVRRFLDREQISADRILILSQERQLTTEAGFGSSRRQIDAALARISESTGGVNDLETRLAVTRLQQLWEQAQDVAQFSSPCSWFPPRAAPDVISYASEQRNRIVTTLNHLNTTTSFLAGVPGVKTLLFVSDSLEKTPGISLYTFVDGLCPGQRDISQLDLVGDLTTDFRRLTRNANANRITLYTLQASGLQGGFLTGPDQRSVELSATRRFDSTLRSSERDGLLLLAKETGGRAIINRNKFAGELDEIAREMGTYYSLAYTPTHGGDRGEHRIKVTVRQRPDLAKKIQVRHRQGYRDKSPDERMADRLESALYLGLMANPLAARLGAGTVRQSAKKFTLPLHVMVPADRVTFLPDSDPQTPSASLMLQVAASDDKNRNVVFEQKRFRFDRPSTANATALLDLAVDLELGSGMHVVAVALRDEATRETSYISTSLSVETPGVDGPG